ncbi:MAG: dienelactone hydrolase family protein [Saprospiraceae bacterium]
MMRLFSFILLCSLFMAACGREKMPMCHNPNTAFAEFASDKSFRDAHPNPVPVSTVHAGKDITFPVAGGADGRGFLVKAHGNSNKYLLLFHEWWGLNENIKAEAARWSHELGINVLAVDLYDGKVATNADDAGKLMQANDMSRSIAIIQGAAAYSGKDTRFYTIGWCFGGGWSLQAALALADRTDKCVVYYGMPETSVDRLKTLNTEVLFIHAKQDQWINDEAVHNFETAMKAAGRKVTVHAYDADHAFANPSGPRYNEAAAKAAREVVTSYLK